MPLRIGTRASALARWQAEWVADQLRQRGIEVELTPIATTGDRRREAIESIGGQGVFTKEIQLALLDGRIDLAVHSLKDLPTAETPGLVFGGGARARAGGRRPDFGRRRVARRVAPRGDDRHRQSAAPGATAPRSPRSEDAGHPRQRRHPPAKAARGRLRRAGAGRGGPAAAGTGRADHPTAALGNRSAGGGTRGAGAGDPRGRRGHAARARPNSTIRPRMRPCWPNGPCWRRSRAAARRRSPLSGGSKAAN